MIVTGNEPRIGGVSATFLIFNRIMGTGVFATPGVIMQLTGSAGLSLMLWLLGTFIAISGAAVYLEFGTAIPRYVTPLPLNPCMQDMQP